MKHVHFRRQVKTERAKQAIHQKRQILIQQISVSFLKCQKCLKTLNWARSGDKQNCDWSLIRISQVQGSRLLKKFVIYMNLILSKIYSVIGVDFRTERETWQLCYVSGLQETREKSVVIVTSPAPPKINIISNWKYFHYWAFDKRRQTFYYNNAHCLQTPL